MLDEPVHVLTRRQQVAVHLFDEQRQRRMGQHGAIGQDAQQGDAVHRQAALEDLRQRGVGVDVDLVDDGADQWHAVAREEGLVEHDLIDGPAHTAFADDDHRRLYACRHIGVGEPHDRTYTGMSGPFDEQHIVIRDETLVGHVDLGSQILDHLATDERLGETARDVHRAHVLERVLQPEEVAHEDGVLVSGDVVHQRIALPHRLGERRGVTALE